MTEQEVNDAFKELKAKYEQKGIVFDEWIQDEYEAERLTHFVRARLCIAPDTFISFQGDIKTKELYAPSIIMKNSFDNDILVHLAQKIKTALQDDTRIKNEAKLMAQNKITFAQDVLKVLEIKTNVNKGE